jgi:hypothetical protein
MLRRRCVCGSRREPRRRRRWPVRPSPGQRWRYRRARSAHAYKNPTRSGSRISIKGALVTSRKTSRPLFIDLAYGRLAVRARNAVRLSGNASSICLMARHTPGAPAHGFYRDDSASRVAWAKNAPAEPLNNTKNAITITPNQKPISICVCGGSAMIARNRRIANTKTNR